MAFTCTINCQQWRNMLRAAMTFTCGCVGVALGTTVGPPRPAVLGGALACAHAHACTAELRDQYTSPHSPDKLAQSPALPADISTQRVQVVTVIDSRHRNGAKVFHQLCASCSRICAILGSSSLQTPCKKE
eukprot:464888-Amphidinium_carterae.1